MKVYIRPNFEFIEYDLADTLTTSGSPAATVPLIQEGEGIDD